MFLDAIRSMPISADAAKAAAGIERWQKATGEVSSDHRRLLDEILAHPNGQKLVEGITGCSPFLASVMAREPRLTLDLLTNGPDAVWADVLSPLDTRPEGDAEAKRALRKARMRASLVIAVADITDTWELPRLTASLSNTAEACIRYALSFALLELNSRGRLDLPDPNHPEQGSGLFVIGMGKLGALELNYSSDIDLIVFYDPEEVPTSRPDRLAQDMVRMTQRWVDLLHDRTADGFAFRTDLRLRPDPASTAPAISIPAAEYYYETAGQNWERAAMIKARIVAGDPECGARFFDFLQKFVWRRSLDFWTIRDIHSIKRQINAHRGGASIAIEGHDVKVGRGGIREIEFFTQTQQLIWGGRNPGLRVRGTCDALSALADSGHITPDAAGELQAAYTFLRTLEHRLQMVTDQQTQLMPTGGGIDHIARFMGFEETGEFSQRLLQTLQTVEKHYAELFEDEPDLSVQGLGNLVFTGADADQGTLQTLSAMGFHAPERVDSAVRGWHHGRMPATRSNRARQLLTEFMPALLQALGDTADPDEAFGNFDHFLHGLPAGVQLFSLIQTHPHLLELIAEICGSAPWLGQHMRRRPAVLDAVISAEFFEALPSRDAQAEALHTLLAQAGDMQDTLDLARRNASDLTFQTGVQLLRCSASANEASPALSAMADLTTEAMAEAVSTAFSERHGYLPGSKPGESGIAVIAYGKWASQQLTPGSDLDMVVLYDSPAVTAESTGAKPLAASTYAARLTQRLVTALTTETESGRLFEIDLRLRPDGEKGALATHMDGFEHYHRNTAWTWEHLALVRARFVCGPSAIAHRFEAARLETLTTARNRDALAKEVRSMRERMAKTFPGKSDWDTKHRRGGMVDAAFIAQFLVLAYANAIPALAEPRDTAGIAKAAAEAGTIGETDARLLADAESFWLNLQAMLRLTGADTDPARLERQAAQAAIARSVGLQEFSEVGALADNYASKIYQMFDRLIA